MKKYGNFGWTPIVYKAKSFAIAAHSAIGQVRKYTEEPYFLHPIRVANTVFNFDRDNPNINNMLAAAMLHDVVEDTKVSLNLISFEFNSSIASLVKMLTDVSKLEDGNREVRRRIDREHTSRASSDAKTIKLADLEDNTRNIWEYDKKFAQTYIPEKRALMNVLVDASSLKLYDHVNQQLQAIEKEMVTFEEDK